MNYVVDIKGKPHEVTPLIRFVQDENGVTYFQQALLPMPKETEGHIDRDARKDFVWCAVPLVKIAKVDPGFRDEESSPTMGKTGLKLV